MGIRSVLMTEQVIYGAPIIHTIDARQRLSSRLLCFSIHPASRCLRLTFQNQGDTDNI